MDTNQKTNTAQKGESESAPAADMNKYVIDRYANSIAYYWKNGARNKKTYKINRSAIIILGAGVTLLSSIASAAFIENNPVLKIIFAVATPIAAAALTMINGFTQSFQSGAAWRDMVLNAERLEKERDRFLATPEEDRNHKKELGILNGIVVNESTAFFKRILDSEYEPEEEENK